MVLPCASTMRRQCPSGSVTSMNVPKRCVWGSVTGNALGRQLGVEGSGVLTAQCDVGGLTDPVFLVPARGVGQHERGLGAPGCHLDPAADAARAWLVGAQLETERLDVELLGPVLVGHIQGDGV